MGLVVSEMEPSIEQSMEAAELRWMFRRSLKSDKFSIPTCQTQDRFGVLQHPARPHCPHSCPSRLKRPDLLVPSAIFLQNAMGCPFMITPKCLIEVLQPCLDIVSTISDGDIKPSKH